METKNRTGWMTVLIVASVIVALVFLTYLGFTVFRVFD
jgi:hypothetical protein